ncbi:uncharacterized protein SAPINGB_P004757 [Magnusiomyces paraingens]|uniref:rRNA-processing protein n=1 Tax=Magnusiomyces paraingens TaxID=2606893 RepID=A0A5E8C3T6_9ASCO|nr:uncharacterized protein SAPINGB_P004757 [Saprochaete ingens]VVT55825.1 unnamed protein product [Saprochaete ingens]
MSDNETTTVPTEAPEVYTGTSVTAQRDTPQTRKSNRTWREQKTPLRISALGVGKTAWEKRVQARTEAAAFKARVQEMKDEKEGERRRRMEERAAREAAKKEKERYAELAKKMHAKKLERLRRKEKRNKMLKER